MTVFEHIEDYVPSHVPLILVLGNFDGVHKGHQEVLKQAQTLAGSTGKVIVITFRNHPSEVLRPEHSTPLLCTLPHKLLLLQEAGVHDVILLSFTTQLAQHSADSFIEYVRKWIPFSHLVLGHDATLGRNKQGDRSKMNDLGQQWGFTVTYVNEFQWEGNTVSSTQIRKFLHEGKLEKVNALLNRPFSIYSLVTRGSGRGKTIGFPTANLDVSKLCLPPFGVYAVDVKHNHHVHRGIVNIGVAPTIRSPSAPLLEVHLFDTQEDLYGKYIEVFFKQFIRPEKKFKDLEELREQIRRDILLLGDNPSP